MNMTAVSTPHNTCRYTFTVPKYQICETLKQWNLHNGTR